MYYAIFFNTIIKVDGVPHFVESADKTQKISIGTRPLRLEIKEGELLSDKLKAIEGFGGGIRKLHIMASVPADYVVENV